MSQYNVGIWMYSNGGGSKIQEELCRQLQERNIATITGLNLANAQVTNGSIICNGVEMESLDAFFSYNAGQQSKYQTYLYGLLNRYIPCLNNYDAFLLSEDKLITAHMLAKAGVSTVDYCLCNVNDKQQLKQTMRDWGGRLVYKPTDGWGGMGIVKIEDERSLDMLFPFLDQTNIPHFYVERFVNYDMSDYRVDIVDGHYIGCYGRKAPANDWKTNITSGGSIIKREPDDELIAVAKNAAAVTGLEIAGVDIIYDLDKQEYLVLEVNGIPAFATPEQEAMGLDFNQEKISRIADLIERKVIAHRAVGKKPSSLLGLSDEQSSPKPATNKRVFNV